MTDACWHTELIDGALRHLNSSKDGLSETDAATRLAAVGPNRLARTKPASAVRILINQLTSIVIWLLGAAVVVSLASGNHLEAVAILVVLVLNAGIGFVTELRARRAMEALFRLEVPRATVIREGGTRVIDASLLVPGDVIELGTGQAVPADGRLIADVELSTDEAALTGESLPSSKDSAQTFPAETALADRTNMVYAGTSVVAGTGHVLVTATGVRTELGRIGALVAGVRDEGTPLERRLARLGRDLVWLALGVAAVVSALEAFHGAPLDQVLETGLALAVAAVPEALPAVATIALAIGLRRMARRHALVRRLPSVEALGSTTIICTDKTRTLTSGDMTIVRVWVAGAEIDTGQPDFASSDNRLRTVIESAVFACRAQALPIEGSGQAGLDPMDAAILGFAPQVGVVPDQLAARRRTLRVVPFSSTRKLAAVFEQTDEATVAYVKGAPGRLIDLSDRMLAADGTRPLDDAVRAELLKANSALASEGLRVLAVASGTVRAPDESALERLMFLGLLGFMDPPAPGVKATIARLRAAGLRTVMITGDQLLTAAAVGRELGLLSSADAILDGRELTELAENTRRERLARAGAISRVTPEQKLTIVSDLQAHGDIVAMLGDGVNDAPALKKADVGVAMGVRGTDVAKEAASIVLLDDRFETIAAAVEEGRVVFDNIRKVVFYLFSCNLAEILVLLVAGLSNLPVPLLPLQILWINLVTDTLPALALAMEPGDQDIMRRPPRDPQDAILSRALVRQVVLYAALITASTLGAFLWALAVNPAQATTMSFMTLALAQVFHLGNARSDSAVLKPRLAFRNLYAVGALGVTFALQLVAVEVAGLASVLRLTPLGLREWVIVLLLAAATALVGQAIRLASRR